MKNKRIIIITIVLILLIVFLLFLVFNYSKDDFIVKNWYTKSEDFSISLEQLTDENYLHSLDIITRFSLLEFAWSNYLKQNPSKKNIPFSKDFQFNSAILRAMCRSKVEIEPHFALMFLPHSDYSPNLIREILSNSSILPDKLLTILDQMRFFHTATSIMRFVFE